MTYREKLELYSQGKLDEQQKIEIEKELEKQEALQDYLFEHQAPPGMEDLFDGLPAFGVSEDNGETPMVKDDSEDIAKQINSSIRRAFIKTGAIATIIAFALTLFIVFALPHIVSAFYYNPSKSIGTDDNGTKIEQLERDISVAAELTIPELGPQIIVGTDSYGYGNYSYFIDASFNIGSNDEKTIENVFTGNLKRDSFVCYNYDKFFKYKDAQYFNSGQQEHDTSLKEMDATSLYYTYVSFDKNISYEKFYADYVDHDEYGTNTSWVWCGIQVSPDEDADYHLKHGFFAAPYHSGAHFQADNEYPNLSWCEGTNLKELDSEEKAFKHFSEMLSYLVNNSDFNNIDGILEPPVMQEEMDYVSENGLDVYGFIYVGDKEHVNEVSKAENVKHVWVETAL